jgi:alpha-tubulin suppressor-like RCC1 family protein
VYVWGQGPCLGLGPQKTLVRIPTQIPSPLFGCNQFSPDVQVVSISSSFFYSGAINSQGDLYTWGKDQNGCLGLGKLKYQHFPLKVAMGASAKKLSLGIDHSLIMGKGGV